MSNVPLSSSLGNFETTIPQRSTRNTVNPVDYKKFFQGKATAVMTNSFVPLNSLYARTSRILFDYTLSHSEKQATRSFVQVMQKKTKLSTPDIPSIKDALRFDDTDIWREVMKVEYEVLIANGT